MDYPMYYSYDTSILHQCSPIQRGSIRKKAESYGGDTDVDFLIQSKLILVNNTLLYRWDCLDKYNPTIGTFAALATRVEMTRQKLMFTSDRSPRFTVCVPISATATTAIARLQSAIRICQRRKRALAFAMASHDRLGESVVSSLSRVLAEPSMLMLIFGFPLCEDLDLVGSQFFGHI